MRVLLPALGRARPRPMAGIAVPMAASEPDRS